MEGDLLSEIFLSSLEVQTFLSNSGHYEIIWNVIASIQSKSFVKNHC